MRDHLHVDGWRFGGHFAVDNTARVSTAPASRLAQRLLFSGQASDPDKVRISGVCAIYGRVSVDLGGYREVYQRGCFHQSLAADDIRMLFNLDPSHVLGRTANSTLIFWDEEDGLHFEVDPPETQWCDDLLVSIERNDIRESGVLGTILQSHYEYRESDKVRVIEKATLKAAAVVSFGNQVGTTASTQTKGKQQIAAGALFLPAMHVLGGIQ